MPDFRSPAASDREFDIVMHECRETFYTFAVPEKEMGELMAALES